MNEPNPFDNPLEGDEHELADAAETTFAPDGFWQQLEHWRWQQQRKARTRQARNNVLTDVLRLLDFNGIDGDYIEFGCFRAETLPLVHRINRKLPMQRHLWAVDSFQGIPEPKSFRDLHPRWQEGRKHTTKEEFLRRCRRAGVPEQAYTTIRCPFSNLGALAPDQLPTNIALAYVNCYLHSQVEQVLEVMRPRLKQGMVIIFDNYFACSRFHQSGDQAAFERFRNQDHGFRFCRYRDFGFAGAAFLAEEPFA